MKRRSRPVLRSSFEDKVVLDLTSRGVAFTYETLKLKYVIPSTSHTYTPDIILGNGVIVEVKGYFELADRKKMLLVIKQHPELDIRMLFMKANKPIRKGSKTTYESWCEDNGIMWAIGIIPEAWYQ